MNELCERIERQVGPIHSLVIALEHLKFGQYGLKAWRSFQVVEGRTVRWVIRIDLITTGIERHPTINIL